MELTPRPWRIEADPGTWLLAAAATPAPEPLLLQLDRLTPLTSGLQQQLQAWLDPLERQRQLALKRPADQQRFLLARAGLRRLLGLWRGEDPARVPIASHRHGKPFCPDGPQFNLSHSGDLILLALHPHRPVGVDVERQRPGLDWEPIARRVLPAAELAVLAALPASQRPERFVQAWCRLEARLKARGCGLAGLERLRGEAVIAGNHPGERLWDVALPPGYHGALACLQPRR
ncbi:MAG: 4'-phosphopantetheinyl transferase superfamily protein [Synechococcus sp.]|nr:4'-phosphopantetheinyl transferase superfamily protein [Synechococcus sp.]